MLVYSVETRKCIWGFFPIIFFLHFLTGFYNLFLHFYAQFINCNDFISFTVELLCCLILLLFILPQHAEMADESVQLKTLQTILIIFQSRLQPENEVRADRMFVLPSLN